MKANPIHSRESRNMYNFIAATDDNNARYRCEASNSMSPQPMKAEIVVSVLCESGKQQRT